MFKRLYVWWLQLHLLLLHIICGIIFHNWLYSGDIDGKQIFVKTIRLFLLFEGSVLCCSLTHRLVIHHQNDINIHTAFKYFLIHFVNMFYVPGYIAFASQHNSGQLTQIKCQHKSELISTHSNYLWFSNKYLMLTNDKWCDTNYFVYRYGINIIIISFLFCYTNNVEIICEIFIYLPIIFNYLCYCGHYLCHHPCYTALTYQTFQNTQYEKLSYNYKSKILQLITFGEILHNNHHHDPLSLTLSTNMNEIDLTHHVILMLKYFNVIACQTVPDPTNVLQIFTENNEFLLFNLLTFLHPFYRSILCSINHKSYEIMNDELIMKLMSKTDSIYFTETFSKFCCPLYESITITNNDIKNHNIQPHDIKNLCYFLIKQNMHSQMEKINNLIGLRLSFIGCMKFVSPIIESAHCTKITSLNFANYLQLNENDINLFIHSIQNRRLKCITCNIEELYFDNDTIINDKIFSKLMNVIKDYFPKLMLLSVTHTRITNKSCDEIVKYFHNHKENPTLKYINIQNNKNITQTGIIRLYEICSILNDKSDVKFIDIAVNGCDANTPKCSLKQCCVNHFDFL